MICGSYLQCEIASLLKVSEQTICNWKKDSGFMEEYEKSTRSTLQSLVPKAIKRIEKLLNANNEVVQLGAAKDILDRTGYKPTDKQDLSISAPTIIFDVADVDDG